MSKTNSGIYKNSRHPKRIPQSKIESKGPEELLKKFNDVIDAMLSFAKGVTALRGHCSNTLNSNTQSCTKGTRKMSTNLLTFESLINFLISYFFQFIIFFPEL